MLIVGKKEKLNSDLAPGEKQGILRYLWKYSSTKGKKVIQTYFERDNFTSRRTTGNNMYDPESLLTGAEIEAGLGYGDLRQWPNQDTYDLAVHGLLPVDAIPTIAPRTKQTQSLSISEFVRQEEERA